MIDVEKIIQVLRTKPADLLANKPDWARVPPEMLAWWGGMLVPGWAVAAQAALAYGAKEVVENIPQPYMTLLAVGMFAVTTAITVWHEYEVLVKKKFVSDIVTTGLHWAGMDAKSAVGVGLGLGWMGAISNPVDIWSVITGPEAFAGNLIARGVLGLVVWGGGNLLIEKNLMGKTKTVE